MKNQLGKSVNQSARLFSRMTILFLLLFAVGNVWAQSAASLPYSHGFEDDAENANWVLLNGTQTNKWHIGTAVAHGESSKSLYISNDAAGATHNYSTSYYTSYVYAYRSLNIAQAGMHSVSFNWRNFGEGNYDNVRAFLVPESIALSAGTATGMTSNTNNVPANWIEVSPVLNGQNTWQTHTNSNVQVTNAGVYKLVFFWKNDNSSGTQQPAAIDNISVRANEPVAELANLPKKAVVNNPLGLSANVLPNTATQSITWSIVDANGTNASIAGNIFTASAPGTATVRATIAEGVDVNTPYTQEFTIEVIQPTVASLPYSHGFEDAADNANWVLLNGTQTNKWHIGTAVAHGESGKSLYISNDAAGATHNYSTSSTSYVYAYRSLNIAQAGMHSVSFNWRSNGDGNYDNVRAFLVPDNIALSAGNANDNTNSTNNVPANWIAVSPVLNGQNTWQTHTNANVQVTNAGVYNLVFFWKNNNSSGTQQPAAIDNISVALERAYEPVTELANLPQKAVVNNPLGLSANVLPNTANPYISISWSIVDANGTNASLAGNIFTASAPGTATVRATIAKEVNVNTPYTKEFTIEVIQPTVASLPYRHNFEDDAENDNWVLENGTQTNKWHIGSAVAHGESGKSLYISNDAAGATHNYNITSTSYVYAYRSFNIAQAGMHSVSFNWRSNGQSSYDNVRAFLVPDNIALSAGNANGNTNSTNSVPANWIAVSPVLNGQNTWQTHTNANVQVTNAGVYKLVFFWKNADFAGTQAPAAIDNIEMRFIPPASLPYSHGFEDDAENANWVLLNGTQVNKWHIGTAVTHGGSAKSLYISNDAAGATHNYNLTSNSYVYAYRSFNIAQAGIHSVSFNWRNSGEGNYDNVRAFLVPESIALAADNANGNTDNAVPANWIAVSPVLSGQNTWQTHINANVQIANAGVYKLVFFWRNNAYSGTQQPAAIDNISVSKAIFDAVTELAALPQKAVANFPLALSAKALPNTANQNITWSIVDANSTNAGITGNIFTASAPGTATVRATIAEGVDVNTPYTQEFTIEVIQPTVASLPYNHGFEDAADNANWVLLNDGQTNKWWIGTAVAHGESGKSLYISNDAAGATHNYSTSSTSYVYAYRSFNIAQAGMHSVSFNWRSYGESSYDNVRAFLVPESIALSAGTATGMTGNANTVPANWIAVSPVLNGQNTWQTHTNANVQIASTGVYNLVFFWKNNNSSGTQQPAAIDNIAVYCREVINASSPAEVTYSAGADVSTLFSFDPNAGTPIYSIEEGGTGIGSLEGSMLTVSKVGTFNIGLVTSATATHLAGAKITGELTVLPKQITITGVTAVERDYNGETTVDLAGGVLEGIVNSDAVPFDLGTGTIANANAGNGKTVATNIALDNQNYVLSAQPAVTVNITPATLTNFTVSAGTAEGKVYDGTANITAGIPTISTTDETFGEDPEIQATFAFSDKNAAVNKSIVAKVTGLTNANFALAGTPVVTPAETDLEITKATPEALALPTATAITYGQAVSASTLSGGTQGGEWAWANESEKLGAGARTIAVTFVPTDTDNYDWSQIETEDLSVSLTVAKAPLTITAENKTATQGDAIPAYTATYSGFANGETKDVLTGTLSFASAYTAESEVGTYDITPSGLTSSNYEIAFVKGTLSVAAKLETPIARPQLAANNVIAYAANNAIVLHNLPQNAKVQVYNLNGKQIYSANPGNPKILKIGVQTGVYIVKINNQTLRVTAR